MISRSVCLLLCGFFFENFHVLAQDTPEPAQAPKTESERKGVKWGIAPIFNFTTDSGLTVGVLSQRFDYGDQERLPFENLLTLQLSYATQGRKSLLVEFEQDHVGEQNFRLVSYGFVSVSPFSPYYGLGDHTDYDSNLARNDFYIYAQDSVSFYQGIRKRLWGNWDGSVALAPTYYRLMPNQTTSQFQTDFGSETQNIFMLKFQAALILDQRDFEFTTSDGHYLSVGATFVPGFLSTTDTWLRWGADFRKYFPIIPDRWLWFATQVTYANSTTEAPFPEKVGLGSQGTIRGLRASRFLSNHVLTYRAELRGMPIRWTILGLPLKMGAGIFTDMGRIGDNFGRLFRGKNHFAWGFSVFGSYFTDDFLGHMDFGFSEEGTSVYVGLGHVF